MKRRAMLARIGAAGTVGALAGCIDRISGSGDDGPGDDDNGADDGTNENGDENGGGNGDEDEASIDGRLHNESAEARTFEVVIRNADDEVVADEEWEVDAGSTENVPAFGVPGEPRTFEISVGEVETTETFEFDVENEPESRDGYVDVTYTEDGELEISFTPIEGDVNGSGDADDDGDADGGNGETDDGASVDESWIDVLGADCGSENGATMDLEGDTVLVHGRITAPDPCHEAVLESIGDRDELVVTVGTEDATEPGVECMECVGEIEYEAGLAFADEPPTPLVVEHATSDGTAEVARLEEAYEG